MLMEQKQRIEEEIFKDHLMPSVFPQPCSNPHTPTQLYGCLARQKSNMPELLFCFNIWKMLNYYSLHISFLTLSPLFVLVLYLRDNENLLFERSAVISGQKQKDS